jgi:DeoR/GlpR family transcriptional regulator of sugar metabolism
MMWTLPEKGSTTRRTNGFIANARHVILVSDSTKFERAAPVRIARIEDVGTFVTDRAPDAIRGCARGRARG